MALGGILATAAGGLGSLLGGIFGGNAADLARRRMLQAANLPGLDVGKTTAESLRTMVQSLPQAQTVSEKINQANAANLSMMLESGIPGYGAGVRSAMGRISDYLSGELPPDVTQAVMRATAASALGRGLGTGTPLHRSLTWRDLGRTSEEGIRYGIQAMMQAPSAFPWARPMDISNLAGLTPSQLVQLREQERMAQQQLLAQAAGMPGQTAFWSNTLGQLGGMALGAGLTNLLQPQTPAFNWPAMYGMTYNPAWQASLPPRF